MTAYAIRAEGLGKRYELGRAIDPHRTAREALVETASGFLRGIGSVLGRRGDTQNAQEFWALRDVSFEVQQGEAVGLIGSNGAGKSTLLKLLSRITAPTTGRAEIRGRVGSLLEVGTGFHPDLTGRENVFLNGAILGMRRSEIERKFDEIVAFAELERFIDTPVKRYSSGMYMRLAFAVAAHLEPEVLLVDEVLAVGDAAFQKKCLGKMGEVTGEGRTVVFVSHNMSAVQALCERVILLESGSIACAGLARDVVDEYASRRNAGISTQWDRPLTASSSALSIERVTSQLLGTQPQLTLKLQISLQSHASHKPAFLAVDVRSFGGSPIMQAVPHVDPLLDGTKARYQIDVQVVLVGLVPGSYTASVWVGSHNNETLDTVEEAIVFEVMDSPIEGRSFPHTRDHGYIVPPSTATWV